MKRFMPYLIAFCLLPLTAKALNLRPESPEKEISAVEESPNSSSEEHAYHHNHDDDEELIDEDSKLPSAEFESCKECLFPHEWLRGLGEEFKTPVPETENAEEFLILASGEKLKTEKTSRALGAMKYPVLGGAKFLSGLGDPRSGGRRHQGIDLGSPMGAGVVAVWPGRVTRAGQNRLGGWAVRIDHPNGYWTYYAHLRRAPEVREGELVQAGQRLGEVGMSGNAKGTTPHLHFEVHNSSSFMNPLAFLGGKEGSQLAYNPNVPKDEDEGNDTSSAYTAKSKGTGVSAFDSFILKNQDKSSDVASKKSGRTRTFENLPGVSVDDYSIR